MGMKIKQSISTLLGVTLFKIVIGAIFSIAFSLLLLLVLVKLGFICPANHSEKLIETTVEKLKQANSAEELFESMPNDIGYLILNSDGSLAKTNLTDDWLEDALAYLRNESGKSYSPTRVRYFAATINDMRVLMQYSIRAYYSIDALNTFLPSPDVVIVVLIIVLTLLNTVTLLLRLSLKFKRELNTLILAAQQAIIENCDVNVPVSRIKEISEVQTAFCRIREDLEKAIQNRQEMQRIQKEQIMALVHDLKTPLTVTIGNLDLLAETELGDEQTTLNTAALESLEKLSEYISLLSEITAAENIYQQQFEMLSLPLLIDAVNKQAELLCKSKQITYIFQNAANKVVLLAEPTMLERAFVNLINNAVRYTEANGTIRLALRQDAEQNRLLVQIEDSGCGFSDSMLRHGKQLFYSNDKGRSSEHFGIGLYFSNLVVEKHNGILNLANSAELGGACVKMELPII